MGGVLKKVRVLLFEPNKMYRANIRSVLEEDFSNIIDTDNFDATIKVLANDDVDLLIASTEHDLKSYWKMMRTLRHGRAQRNRFVVSIALLAEPNDKKIRAVIDSAADVLQSVPVAPGELRSKIDYFKTARKPFVVTMDYIGPDRRGPSRDGGGLEIPEITIPNPVQLMAEGQTPRDVYLDMVKTASKEIDKQAALRNGYQLVWLADNISNAYLQNKISDELFGRIDRMIKVSSQMPKRLEQTPFVKATDVCKRLNQLAQDLKTSKEKPSQEHLEQLPELSREIDRFFVS